MLNKIEVPRYYFFPLAEAVDHLIAVISTWEGDNFSASGVDLTRREAQEVAARYIQESLVVGLLCPVSLDGSKLLNYLQEVRGEGVEVFNG
jgi:hypothetical protein